MTFLSSTDLLLETDQSKVGSVSVFRDDTEDDPDLNILSIELILLDTYMAKFPKRCSNTLPTTFSLEFRNPVIANDSSEHERLNLKLTYLTSVNDKQLSKTVRVGNIYTIGRVTEPTRILNDISFSKVTLGNNKDLGELEASGSLQLKES